MKVILFVFFISCISFPVFSQNNLGIRAGVNFSGLPSESNFGLQMRFSWHAGLIGKKYVGEIGYFLQGELLYQKQGNQNHHLDYLKIPLMVGFDYSDNMNIHLGLYYGNRLKNNEDFIKSDWGGVIGLDFYTSKRTIFTTRLDYGFQNIVADDANLNFVNAKNMVIDMSLVYLFNRKN